MNKIKLLPWLREVMLIVMFLVGCGAPSNSTLTSLAPPTGQPRSCPKDQISPLGVLRSTDHGATWTSLGNACIRDLKAVKPADPTGLVIDGRIVLYFIDLAMQPTSEILYRTTSADGVNFDTPQATYHLSRALYDPFVLRLPDSSFRVYIPTGPEGIISAKSSDGLSFVREEGVRGRGNMPGAIVLPDDRVRLFLNEDRRILSAISTDGLNFSEEQGERIPAAANIQLSNPQPIRLADGSYLMLYQAQDEKHIGRPDWMAEIHLATSSDGFHWTIDPKVIEYGGTSCLVKQDDGTLLIYYGR